jgi:hypothetical protein
MFNDDPGPALNEYNKLLFQFFKGFVNV